MSTPVRGSTTREAPVKSAGVVMRGKTAGTVDGFPAILAAQGVNGDIKPARVAFGGNDLPAGALVEIDAIAAL